MVFFGHHRQQQSRLQQQEAALARKARDPYGLGNSPYRGTTAATSRRHPYEVDADGDIDDLCEQEIQRYEELFENSNRDGFGGLNDDDTLNDQSIYTSTPTLQGPPSSARSLRPSGLRNQTKQEQDSEEEEEQEVESMWGLEDPYKFSVKPAPTSLLTPQEEAAAAKLATLKKKKAKAAAAPKSSFKPSTSSIPAKNRTEITKEKPNREIQKNHKKKPLFSPKRFFNRQASQKSCATPASRPSTEVASRNSKQQQQVASKTPKTQASTPAPPTSTPASKKKFFASPARLFSAKKDKLHKPERQQHPNLLLASFSASAANNNATKYPSPPSPSMNVRGNSASYVPPASPSPPPPMDDFDVCSVISAQSSLTDALDAWMISNSPPQIIGGDHLQQSAPEEYNGNDLSPISGPVLDDDVADADVEDVKPNEVNTSVESPAAVRLTKEELFHHDTQITREGKETSEHQSSSSPPVPSTDLIESVRAVKEQREKRKEEKTQLYEDIDPEDADMHVVQILGLHNPETEEEDGSRSKQSSQVKRKLFGSQSEDAIIEKEDEKEASEDKAKKTTAAAQPEKDKESPMVALKTSERPNDPKAKAKSSRFRKFFSKIVHSNNGNHNRKISHQEWLEYERVRVQEAQTEKLRLEHEESKRIQQKKQQALERQRKLHLVESNSTAEETSNPISSSTSRAATPTSASSPTLCVHCQSNDRTHIVLPCMHYTLCDDCVEQARQADSCHCLTCDTAGFLYARVGVLEGPELQEKLLQQATPTKAAAATVQALAFQQ